MGVSFILGNENLLVLTSIGWKTERMVPMTKDMTKGSPMRLILGFSIPILFGSLFQQFYNIVDTVIVGRFLGVDNLAAVGATGSVCFLTIGFCIGICSGFAIPLSHKFGAEDYAGLRRYTANCMWLSIGFSVVLTILTTVLCRQVLVWMRTPEDILENAYQYLSVIFLGIPVIFLYNMVAAIIRSLGDSRTPVMFLILASFLNIALDLFFIISLHMGVAGAAWATVLSEAISGVCCLLYMIRKFDILHIQKGEWAPDGHMMGVLCGMGIPMGLQYSITAIGSVILQSATNTLGSMAVASVTAASRIGNFLGCPFEAMGNTMATYGGQNVGAKKLERIGVGLKACISLGIGYAVIALLVSIFLGKPLAILFVDAAKTEIISNAHLYLMINTAGYSLLALVNIIRFLIQGMGFSRFAILAGVLEMIARSLVAFTLVPVIGFLGTCLGDPTAWVFADAFLIPAYFHVMKVLRRRLDNGEEL